MNSKQSANASPAGMPKCCISGCSSNFSGTGYTTVFNIPEDSNRRALWLQHMPPKNLNITKNSVVCIKHFSEKFIIRCDTSTHLNGSTLTIARKNPRLGKEAYPTLFSDLRSDPTSTLQHMERAKEEQSRGSVVGQKSGGKPVSDLSEQNKTNNSPKDFIEVAENITRPTFGNNNHLQPVGQEGEQLHGQAETRKASTSAPQQMFGSSGVENKVCDSNNGTEYLSDVSSMDLSTPPSPTPPSPKRKKRTHDDSTLIEHISRFHDESSTQQKEIIQGLKDINNTLKILIDIVRSK